MIVTFCGHSDLCNLQEYHDQMMELLCRIVGDTPCDFYLGGYGRFDHFARRCCAEYKQTHPRVRLFFITPYLDNPRRPNEYTFEEQVNKLYDGSIYPEIENAPRRFAISHRNRWMVEKADAVIAYVDHHYGGAYKTYRCAKAKKKPTYNLSPKEPD